jgi:hypothetical protein
VIALNAPHKDAKMNAATMTSRYSPEFDQPARGDPITAGRYISTEWLALEMEHLWPRPR